MKEKKKKKIMPCIKGMVSEIFSRNLYFDDGLLGSIGLTLTISYERSGNGMTAKLEVITDDGLADSREVMGTLFRCISIAGKKDGIEWAFNECEYDYTFCITASNFDAIHDLLASAVNASKNIPDHCAEPLLYKMKEVAGAFAVEYKRFAGWREEVWNKSC